MDYYGLIQIRAAFHGLILLFVEEVLSAIYTVSLTFYGINSGVISLVAFEFSTIPRDRSGLVRFYIESVGRYGKGHNFVGSIRKS
jgi:hypothetical protein